MCPVFTSSRLPRPTSRSPMRYRGPRFRPTNSAWTSGEASPASFAAASSKLLGEDNPGTFTVITGDSNGVSTDIYDRRPVWLAPSRAEAWMRADTRDAMEMLLASEPQALDAYPVSRAVNTAATTPNSCCSPSPNEAARARSQVLPLEQVLTCSFSSTRRQGACRFDQCRGGTVSEQRNREFPARARSAKPRAARPWKRSVARWASARPRSTRGARSSAGLA